MHGRLLKESFGYSKPEHSGVNYHRSMARTKQHIDGIKNGFVREYST
jgi:hypothetical protein